MLHITRHIYSQGMLQHAQHDTIDPSDVTPTIQAEQAEQARKLRQIPDPEDRTHPLVMTAT